MRRNCTEPKGGDERPKVLMYYTYADRIGGPLTYMKTVMNSPLQEKYRFAALFQNEAPGGLNLPLLRRMTAAIRREKPDIVHVQGAQSEGFYGTLAARLALQRRRQILSAGQAVSVPVVRGTADPADGPPCVLRV